MNILIMAGGKGERFWPLSSPSVPKQLLPILSSRSMIEETVARFDGLIGKENIFISTCEELKGRIRHLLRQIPADNFIIEPESKDTAAAVGLAALHIRKRYPGSVMAVVPADHYIKENGLFLRDLVTAEKTALESGCLLTFGIVPSRPETGYGYIELGEVVHNTLENPAYEVKSFREKPDPEKAREYIAQGGFVWNSGLFVWSVNAVLEALEKTMPDLFARLMDIQEHLGTGREKEATRECFASLPRISVDYGVMEKADNVLCMKARFTWDDVGTWSSLERFNPKDDSGNIFKSDWKGLETRNTILYGDTGLICTIGVEDLLIIRNRDTVLVARKDREQDIKKLLDELKSDETLKKYLEE